MEREKKLPKWAQKVINDLRKQLDKKCSNCNCIHCGERFVTGMADHLIVCSKNLDKGKNYE